MTNDPQTAARVRLESSQAAYRAALEWIRQLPAAEVERRLAAKLADVSQLLDAIDARPAQRLRELVRRTAPRQLRAAVGVLQLRDAREQP